MMVEEVAPAMIAERSRFLGRADNVSKKHRGNHAVDCNWWPHAGQKLLDCVGNVAGVVADKRKVVDSGKLAGPREYAGQEIVRPPR
jgi:hypothetical protein